MASYLSANDTRLHIGLGGAASARIELLWPSGRRQVLDDVRANQIVVVKEPEAGSGPGQ